MTPEKAFELDKERGRERGRSSLLTTEFLCDSPCTQIVIDCATMSEEASPGTVLVLALKLLIEF